MGATRATSGLQGRLGKALATFQAQGASSLLRQLVYTFYYHRHERRRTRCRFDQRVDAMIELWGRQFELPRQHAGLAEELSMYGTREPMATAVYQSLLRPGDHVVEVGANVGFWLATAAQATGPEGRFVAFEPVPSNYAILKRNLDRLRPLDCRHWPWAIGSTNGRAVFFESNVSNYGGLIRHARQDVKQEISVEVRCLDDVLAGDSEFRPAALRMDVEGAELQVLAGARRILDRHRPLLFIECHPFVVGMDAFLDALHDLRSLGYQRGVLIDRRWDQPWLPHWAVVRRCWRGSLQSLSDRLSAYRSEFPVFTLLVERTP